MNLVPCSYVCFPCTAPSPASAFWLELSSFLSTKRSWRRFVPTTELESTARSRCRRLRSRWVMPSTRSQLKSPLLLLSFCVFLYNVCKLHLLGGFRSGFREAPAESRGFYSVKVFWIYLDSVVWMLAEVTELPAHWFRQTRAAANRRAHIIIMNFIILKWTVTKCFCKS